MISRPCLGCGELIPSATYCADCQPAEQVRKGPGDAAYDRIWRKLSLKARSIQPWCTDCSGTADTTDHIIPKSVAPELVHAIENCAPRCRSCNSYRGTTGFTLTDALGVLTRLESTYRRRPTRKGRERVEAAQRAIQTLRGGPQAVTGQSVGKPQGALLTPGGMS